MDEVLEVETRNLRFWGGRTARLRDQPGLGAYSEPVVPNRGEKSLWDKTSTFRVNHRRTISKSVMQTGNVAVSGPDLLASPRCPFETCPGLSHKAL